MSERGGGRERSEQSGASERVSGASERANGQASGPVLTSLFLFVPDHSAAAPVVSAATAAASPVLTFDPTSSNVLGGAGLSGNLHFIIPAPGVHVSGLPKNGTVVTAMPAKNATTTTTPIAMTPETPPSVPPTQPLKLHIPPMGGSAAPLGNRQTLLITSSSVAGSHVSSGANRALGASSSSAFTVAKKTSMAPVSSVATTPISTLLAAPNAGFQVREKREILLLLLLFFLLSFCLQ